MIYRYCCDPDCACDEVGGLNLPSCKSLDALAESLSPMACYKNSSQCPPSGAAAGCNNGKNYYACGSYGCEYSSCSGQQIQQQLCQLECDICYFVPYTLEFLDRHKRSWNFTSNPFLGFNIESANAFKAAHPVNSTIVAYYKPSNPRIVLFTIDFRARNWGILVIFGFPLFVAAAVLTQYALASILKEFSPALVQIDLHLNIALWIGIIWPFIILLPILKIGYVKPDGKKALKVLIPLLTAFGWLPLIFYRLQQLEWSKIGSTMLAFIFFFVPLGVILPCMLVLVNSSTTSMSIGIFVGALLFALLVFLTASWRQILTFRIYF
ncbi:hypothetical protein KP509_03G045600 [Ceratopteris richardii]|uniref:Uncharacterized protein n=1 Tax=Ceratopteris richardii TaxID=49495 RepID=A0A8T2VB51_CERRI|nr:hypothetical protein KP509_03G045600 [Ceratopteris richardii]